MNTIGLSRNHVQLLDHQAEWSSLFTNETGSIRAALNSPSLTVEHIGSTAIPGIYAKPIVDIAIPYTATEEAKKYTPLLEKIGYIYKGEEGVVGRFFYVKGSEEKRSFYLHLVSPDEFNRLISFRDALRSNPQLAKEYSELKQELAEKFTNDRKSYTQAKSQFIARILSIS